MLTQFRFGKRDFHPTHIFWWVIVLLLAVGCLGMSGLNRDAMWYDEIYSYIYAGGEQYGPIPSEKVYTRVVSQLEHEKNPPGYYLLLHFWLKLAGSSPLAGRLLSLVVGLVSVALTYRLGRDYAKSVGIQQSALVGLGSAVTVGASAYYGYYLHELRAYTMVVACTAFEVWAYLKLSQPFADKSRSWGLKLAFLMVMSVSLYLHYELLFVALILGLYHVVMVRMTKQWWHLMLIFAAVGLLYLPWVWSVYQFSQTSIVHGVVGLNASEAISALLLTFSNNSVAFLGLVAVFAIYKTVRLLRMILFLTAIGLIVVLTVNAVYSFINQIRYIIFLWPLLAVVVGMGVERLRRSGVSPLVVLGLWATAGVWTMGANDFSSYLNGVIPSWREFRKVMQSQARAGDVVVYHAGNYDWIRSLELDHYLYGLPLTHQMMEYLPGKPENNSYYSQARTYLADKTNVWIVVSHIDPPNFRLGDFRRALEEEGYAACYTALDDESMTVTLETRLLGEPANMQLLFGDGIGLQLVEDLHVDNNGKLVVVLGSMKSGDVPNDRFSVAIHAVDPDGNLVAQADYGLPNTFRGCTKMTLNVPVGTYSLFVAVYNWQTDERLVGYDSVTDKRGDRLLVANFTIP